MFALFLATCLLSSEIPKVHASQEDTAIPEGSTEQSIPNELEILDETEDFIETESPDTPDDNIETENPDIPDDNVETENPDIPDDNIEMVNPDTPDDNVETENPDIPDDNIEIENPDTPDDNIETESPIIPDDSIEMVSPDIPKDTTIPETPIQPEIPNEIENPDEQEENIAPFSIEPRANGEIPTQQEASDIIMAFQEKEGFKHGTTWTDSTNIPGTNSPNYTYKGGPLSIGGANITTGTGCAAFSFILNDAIFGGAFEARALSTGSFKLSDVKIGDILRVKGNSHSVIVLQTTNDGAIVAEANYNKQVHWGRTLTKSEVEAADFLVTCYPEVYNPDDPDADKPVEGGSGTLGANLTWTLTQGGKLTISGNGAMPDFASNTDQPWNKFNDQILTIVIEDGVTNIGNNAFYNSNAFSVSIPNTVNTIGNNAFRGSSITSVTIPSSVETINSDAFRECSKIRSVTVSDGVKTIGERVFQGCTQLTSVELPASIESVGGGAFFNCTKLESVIFAPSNGNNAVTMGADMFSGCHVLNNVTLPSKADCISNGMFTSCISLPSINIPQGVQNIGERAFSSCGQLTKITIPKTVTQIGTAAFASCGSLKDIYFNGSEAEWNNIRKIGDSQSIAAGRTIHYNAYTLTVENGTGGGGYEAGNIVTITAAAPDGKVFDKWTSDNADVNFADATSPTTTFTMPAANVTVTATYKEEGTTPPEPSEKYTLTVENGTGDGEYEAGETINITATVLDGKAFKEWTSDNGGSFANAKSASTTFTMPAANVTITATYQDVSKPDPTKEYQLTVNNGSGSGNYDDGDIVEITAKAPEAGKVFDKWTSDNTDVKFADVTSASTTFTMPATDVTITATYKNVPSPDVPTKPQKPQNVTINKTSAELNVQETLDLQAAVVPSTFSQDIIWSIDNEKLAELTVDASKPTIAKITAKAQGTVIVTAKSKAYPELSANCTIDIKGNSSNLADLNDTIAKISAVNYDVSGKTVNTKAKAEKWIKEKIDALKSEDITIDSIDITDFTPAKSKEKGSFTFTVTLSKGEGKDKVTLTSDVLNGVIAKIGGSSSGGGGGSSSSSSSSSNNGSSSSNNTGNNKSENTNNETANNVNEDTNNENINNINNTNNTTSNTSSQNTSVDKFVDVSNHWATDSIQFVVEKGYFAGTSENSFSPDVPMTRAMIVSVLGRVANVQGNITTKFSDINQSQYYAPFIGWALENGIASGVSETEFNPNANVTREQLAVMVSNFIKSQGYALNTEKEAVFTDNANISPWAVESVEFMVKAGILNGRTDGSFDPKGVATRAEVATILKLFLEKVNK